MASKKEKKEEEQDHHDFLLSSSSFSSSSSISSSPMPVWIDDTHLSPEWLEAKMGMKAKSIKSCIAMDVSNANRKGKKNNDGATLRLSVTMLGDHKEEEEEFSKDHHRPWCEANLVRSSHCKSLNRNLSLIIKQTTEKNQLTLSKKLGLAREALFYNQLVLRQQQDQQEEGEQSYEQHQILPITKMESIPNIYYSYGDFYNTGEKCIIMEDMNDNNTTTITMKQHQEQGHRLQNCIDSGILFGKGNPNNWERNIPDLIEKAFSHKIPVPSGKEVALTTFREIAKIHATYWKNDTLLLTNDKIWLRGQEWLQGKGRESWELSQEIVCTLWKKYLDSEVELNHHGCHLIQWDPIVRTFVEKAVHGISWNDQLKRLNQEGHWTLVHGDFWPGNVMWMINENSTDEKINKTSSSVCFLDWEMVGLGSGPQELGQYVISNMNPVERKACEKELVEAYMEALKKHMKRVHHIEQSFIESITWDYCWKEYKIGAVERWIWFLVYFVGNQLGNWAQFFHDQLSCFIQDHGLLPTDITQPRP